MNDRYDIEYFDPQESEAIGRFCAYIATGFFYAVVESLFNMYDKHGCKVTDTKLDIEAIGTGETKYEARQKAFECLKELKNEYFKEKNQKKKEELNSRLEGLNGALTRKQDFLKKLEYQLEELNDKLERAYSSDYKEKIDSRISHTESKIDEVKDQITSLEDKISSTESRIQQLD